MRARIELALACAGAAAGSAYLAFWPRTPADYLHDAGPTLHPLLNGHLRAALAHQPAMGWLSIVVRAPFAFFARHSSMLLEYRLGALPCVLALAALGVYLAARMRRAGHPATICALVLALAVLGPMNWHAVADGHPEELLGGALCVATVLIAGSGRSPALAGVTLGLAIATKQWAVLAAGPAFLAAPRARLKLTGTAVTIAGALTLIPVLAGPHDVLSPATSIASASTRAMPASIWWPLGHARHLTAAGWDVEIRTISRSLAGLTHPLIVLLGVLLPLPLLPRRRATSTTTALALLSLLLLLRCVLDPMTIGYYHVPMLVSLLAFEALGRRGTPVLSAISAAVLFELVARVPWGTEPAKVAAIYFAWALPIAAYLALRTYAPSVISCLGKWLSTSLPSSVTTTRSSIRTPNAPGM